MDVLSSVVNWIVSLGASVFLPIVMLIIGIIFGMKPGKAFKAGVMLGIASRRSAHLTAHSSLAPSLRSLRPRWRTLAPALSSSMWAGRPLP